MDKTFDYECCECGEPLTLYQDDELECTCGSTNLELVGEPDDE